MADIAAEQAKKNASAERKEHLALLEQTLRKVPEYGAESLFEAMQSYMLLWQSCALSKRQTHLPSQSALRTEFLNPYRQKSV
jgi:formate C-acetyltransferase